MNTIEALKKRLNLNKLVVQKEEGYVAEEVFKFNPPASKDEIAKLPPYVPTEIMEFLSQHNGADLFDHPENGGGTHLFSVEEILEHIDIWECPEYFIPIGYGMDSAWIACQVDKKSKENYMWIGSFLDFEDEDEFWKLPMDFPTWLDRFIVCQGCSFWDWTR